MTVLTRGGRARRGGRRPGWLLLTVLLVLAIGASSALVFTNRVELLKLAVILALWAAVVAAFVSVIYRRQSDVDQATVRDLKLVYDLQLDREISARREYELTVETQLRRELALELRAQAVDEVEGLRAELAALRANLEMLFDADLSHRPALETDRATVRAYSDWARDAEAGRVTSSRIDTEDRDDDARTEESPIIDVPEEPHPPEPEWVPPAVDGGAHRRSSEAPPAPDERPGKRRRSEEPQRVWSPPPEPPPPPPPPPPPRREPEPPPPPPPPPPPRQEPERVAADTPPAGWQPAPAEGQWIPAGAPGSNWVAPVPKNGSADDYVGRRRAPGHPSVPDSPAQPAVPDSPAQPSHPSVPAMSSPSAEARRGRHSAPPESVDPGRPPSPPTLAAEPAQPPPPPPSRHHSADEPPAEDAGQHAGGQSVAELLARLQASSTGGGRRRRRED